MDDVGHAAWAYLIWLGTPFPGLAVLMSVFPDFVGFMPTYIVAFFRNKGNWSATWNKKNMPSWSARYRHLMFNWTHSIIVSLLVSAVTLLIFGWRASWMLAWPMHVFIDIFTHGKEQAFEYLWPVSTRKFHGIPWHGKPFMIGNYLALIVAYCLVFLR